jgi:MFS transporter, putative metabolite:H+ symporter
MNSRSTSEKILTPLVIVAALGYFVDIYDLVLFGMERTHSLKEIFAEQFHIPSVLNEAQQKGVDRILSEPVKNVGISLFNWQMFGMLLGGIIWGIIGDKKGRLSVLFGSILTYSIANIANGFVNDTNWYAVLRFISGFGLAGELGAGITLVSETMTKERRGYGATFVASVGLFGAVVAGIVGLVVNNWRVSYFVGGGMGLVLLLMRIGILESGMFTQVKESNVSRGNFFALFTTKERFRKFITIILVALPVWYVMGILINLCPEIAKAMGMNSVNPKNLPDTRIALTVAYAGITVGDIVSGLMSQYYKSRKKSLLIFLLLTVFFTVIYFLFAFKSLTAFYTVVVLIGFATGYWAVFISTASELFGTNLRATVTTSVPNFVRGGAIVLTTMFQFLTINMGATATLSAIVVGILTFTAAFIAWYKLDETFHKDLNYTE